MLTKHERLGFILTTFFVVPFSSCDALHLRAHWLEKEEHCSTHTSQHEEQQSTFAWTGSGTLCTAPSTLKMRIFGVGFFRVLDRWSTTEEVLATSGEVVSARCVEGRVCAVTRKGREGDAFCMQDSLLGCC